MGRSLGEDVSRAPRPAGESKPRGARSSFVLRRMRFASLLPISLLLAVLTSTTVTTALASFGARALPSAVHQRLAQAQGTSIRVSGQIGAAQARADTKVVASKIHAALGHVPVAMSSGLWSDQFALPRTNGATQAPLLQAAALGGVRAQVRLTAGSWPGPPAPGQPVGVLLPAATAAMLHMSVGEVLTLPDSLAGGHARLRVTGLFKPRDPTAQYWGLSLLGTSGKFVQGTFVTYGPALADPAALGSGKLGVSAGSWLLTVDTGRISPGSAASLGSRLRAATSALAGEQRLGGLEVATSLPPTLTALASSLVVARSLLLIGSLQLLLLAAAAAILAARLLAGQREEENALLSARGVARGQLAKASLAEAVLLAVVGAAAGIVLGSLLANALMSANGLPVSSAGGPAGIVARGVAGGDWWPGAVIMVLVIVLVMWSAIRPGNPGVIRLKRGRQAMVAATAQAGLDAAVIALGVLSLWELRRYSAVPRLSGGSLGIDPVLSVAPVLALAGTALLPLRLLPAAARVLDRLSARGKRLAGALASWQLSRRPVRQGGPILLVVLAVATGTLVLAQHQSWRQSQLDQAAFTAGAGVRVSLPAPLPLGRGATISHAPGVLAAVPVSEFNSGFDVFALGAAQAAGTVLLRPDLAMQPPARLWHMITPGASVSGLVLPGRPERLDLSATLRPPSGALLGTVTASASVRDASGIVYSVPAGSLPPDGRPHQLTVALSSTGQASYPLRLLGLTLSYRLPGFPAPPYPGHPAQPAAQRLEHSEAAARATLTLGALAVSGPGSGASPAPFAQGDALLRWQVGGTSPDLANPAAAGVAPRITSWQAAGSAAALTFKIGAGHVTRPKNQPPLPATGQLSLTTTDPGVPVPAIATRAFLASASAHVGQVVGLPVGNVTVPVRLVAQIRAFPTAGGAAPAVIVDQGWVQQVLEYQAQPPLPVNQWWLATTGDTIPPLPAGASAVSAAKTAAGLLGDPLPNVPQLSLLVIVVAAGLLAGIGFVVSVVAAVRERRLQDALLAALGVGRAARAGQLCLEQLMLSVPAAVAGTVIGLILAHLLVPPVTLTTGATAPFPPVHVVIPVGWIALLAAGIAAVPVLAAAAAAAHRPDPAAQLRAGDTA